MAESKTYKGVCTPMESLGPVKRTGGAGEYDGEKGYPKRTGGLVPEKIIDGRVKATDQTAPGYTNKK